MNPLLKPQIRSRSFAGASSSEAASSTLGLHLKSTSISLSLAGGLFGLVRFPSLALLKGIVSTRRRLLQDLASTFRQQLITTPPPSIGNYAALIT